MFEDKTVILTDEIDKALNEGYEISLKKVDEFGPEVVEIRLKKDGVTYGAMEDLTLCETTHDIANYIDRSIRYIKEVRDA